MPTHPQNSIFTRAEKFRRPTPPAVSTPPPPPSGHAEPGQHQHPATQSPTLLQRFQSSKDSQERSELFAALEKEKQETRSETRESLIQQWKAETDPTRKAELRDMIAQHPA